MQTLALQLLGRFSVAVDGVKALHFARLAMGDEQAIVNERGALVLGPGAVVESDLARFEAAAQHALDAGDTAVSRAAADLYRGELLPDDLYESWSVEPRARLRRRYLDVLRAGALWDRLAEEDPTDEQAARALMHAHLQAGSAGRRFAASSGCARRSGIISVSGRTRRPSHSTRTRLPSRARSRPLMPSAHMRCSHGPSCT